MFFTNLKCLLVMFSTVVFSVSVFVKMLDSESIQKMLRSVLISSKTGVSVNNIQSEYRSLCGEIIPLRKLGYSTLEDYLKSIPSVVRLEYRMGEVRADFSWKPDFDSRAALSWNLNHNYDRSCLTIFCCL